MPYLSYDLENPILLTTFIDVTANYLSIILNNLLLYLQAMSNLLSTLLLLIITLHMIYATYTNL